MHIHCTHHFGAQLRGNERQQRVVTETQAHRVLINDLQALRTDNVLMTQITSYNFVTIDTRNTDGTIVLKH